MARPTWRILVAEPDEANLQLIDMLLAEPGFDLTLVKSGADALEHLKENIPDLCLLAMDLPDVGGDEICFKIRRVTRLSTIHVVLVAEQSGRFGLSDEVKRRSKRVGADLVLPRPLGDKNLKDRLKALLEERAEVPLPAADDDELMDVMEDALDAADELPDGVAVGRPGSGLPSSAEDMSALLDEATPGAEDAMSGADDGAALSATPKELVPDGADEPSVTAAPSDGSTEEDAAAAHGDPDEASGSQPGEPDLQGPTHARHGPQAAMTPPKMPGNDTAADPEASAKLAKIRKELEILQIENAQLKRKLKEKQDVIDRGINTELEDRVRELERRNAALLDKLEKKEESSGGRRGRRR